MTESSRTDADALPWAGTDGGLEGVDSARTKLVALCLARERSATLAELQAALDEPRLSLLRILGVLSDRGLVERVEGTYHFRGEPDDAPTGDEAEPADTADDATEPRSPGIADDGPSPVGESEPADRTAPEPSAADPAVADSPSTDASGTEPSAPERSLATPRTAEDE